MATAESTRAGWPICSSAPSIASAFITVASMPIEFGARPLDALVRALQAAKEIAAADDHRHLHAEFRRRLQVGGHALDGFRVEAERVRAHQRLAGELDHDAVEQRS